MKRSPMKRKPHRGVRLPQTLRFRVLNRDGYVCQYCGGVGYTVDHIVPKADRRRAEVGDYDDRYMVACCLDCNGRKSTRRLVPPSWEPRLVELNELIPTGARFRCWSGDVREPAYAETWR